MPAQRKVPPSDLFIKDKFVSEELRNFAVEYDYLFATASQLNRAAVEEIEFDHSHISGGLSKIQTADNVIGIFTSQAMRESVVSIKSIQFMKTRSSAGVGQKVDLNFDRSGLRISDIGDDEETVDEVSELYNKLKKKSSEPSSVEQNTTPASTMAVVDTDRLRSILKKQD